MCHALTNVKKLNFKKINFLIVILTWCLSVLVSSFVEQSSQHTTELYTLTQVITLDGQQCLLISGGLAQCRLTFTLSPSFHAVKIARTVAKNFTKFQTLILQQIDSQKCHKHFILPIYFVVIVHTKRNNFYYFFLWFNFTFYQFSKCSGIFLIWLP